MFQGNRIENLRCAANLKNLLFISHAPGYMGGEFDWKELLADVFESRHGYILIGSLFAWLCRRVGKAGTCTRVLGIRGQFP